MKPIVYTLHGLEKLYERRISLDWVERTIRNPDVSRPDAVRIPTIRAFKVIPERDGRALRVVFVEDDEAIRVITAFFDRGARL